jgi:hypothetical protein
MQPVSRTVVAYWDFYDAASGKILERERAAFKVAMPFAGVLVTNVPGKPNAVIRSIKFSRIVKGLPCYDVYV